MLRKDHEWMDSIARPNKAIGFLLLRRISPVTGQRFGTIAYLSIKIRHMKKFGLLIILSLTTLGAWSQNFTGGLKAGLIASTINGDNFGGFRQAGLMAGGYVQYPINDFLNFQPEIIYEGLGSRNSLGTEGLRTNYVSLPLLLNANLNFEINEQKFGIGLDAGPSIGYLLGARDQITDINTTSTYHRVDYKLVGGIVLRISEQVHFSSRISGSVISFLTQGGRRSSCFNNLPGFCHYYATFELRWQIISR